MNKAIFFDLDGTLVKTNVVDGLPKAIHEKVDFVDGAIELAEHLKSEGYLLFVVSNCPDIAKGLTKQQIVEWKCRAVFNSIDIQQFYICNHSTSDNCECRKPKTRFILDAKKEYDLDLENSWFIGDRWSDIECGKNSGMKTIFIDYDYNETFPVNQNYTVDSITEIKNIFEGLENGN